MGLNWAYMFSTTDFWTLMLGIIILVFGLVILFAKTRSIALKLVGLVILFVGMSVTFYELWVLSQYIAAVGI